jgi:hopene-associated glycosyltransferase HpnB
MPDTIIVVFAAISLFCWVHLCWGRGGFWRADHRLPSETAELGTWPVVAAVIPARNEAESIGRAVLSLPTQDYPGVLRIVVVDDSSTDGTRAEAERASGSAGKLLVIGAEALPAGWTGKLWAVQQGVKLVAETWPETTHLLLTDADIEHHSANVRRLVAKGETERRDLVSLMVRLRCQTFWERLLVPAFVFFFQKLFPFPRVNDSTRPEAAAAGGCMLVCRATLEGAGGIAAIRDRLIDDCALAARIKSCGSIWLGLAEETRSLRPYPRLRDFWAMVARTAYTQLGHSPLQLTVTIVVMSVVYLTPALATGWGVCAGNLYAAALGAVASLIMIGTFRPTLTLYDMPLGWSLALPLAAVLYTLMTIDSARRAWLGRGGFWKGRNFEGGLRVDLGAE